MPYTEASYEKSIIQLLEEMGYRHICGYDIDRDYKCCIWMSWATHSAGSIPRCISLRTFKTAMMFIMSRTQISLNYMSSSHQCL